MTGMNWSAIFSAVALLAISACSPRSPAPTDAAPPSPPVTEAEDTSSPAAADEPPAAAAEEPAAATDTPAQSAGAETGATETSARTEGGRVLNAIGRALRKSVAAGAEETPGSAPTFGP